MCVRYVFWIVILITVYACAVQADIRTIPPGGTIFIGEEQVDISGSGIGPQAQIAWWAPGTSLDESPADVITVSDPTHFSVLASSFSGREGIWYALTGKTPVFKIKQPKISIRVYDTSSDFDATGKWIPKGDTVSFRIGTNLHEMRNRPGVTGAPIDIIITTPGGATYSSVSGPAGLYSLTGIPVISSLHDTGPVWSTGGVESGTYSLRAECTANWINSNNPQAGVSETVTVLIQGTNPLIQKKETGEGELMEGKDSEPAFEPEVSPTEKVSHLDGASPETVNISPPSSQGSVQPSPPVPSIPSLTPASVSGAGEQITNQTQIPVSSPVPALTPVQTTTESTKSPFPVAMILIAILAVLRRKL